MSADSASSEIRSVGAPLRRLSLAAAIFLGISPTSVLAAELSIVEPPSEIAQGQALSIQLADGVAGTVRVDRNKLRIAFNQSATLDLADVAGRFGSAAKMIQQSPDGSELVANLRGGYSAFVNSDDGQLTLVLSDESAAPDRTEPIGADPIAFGDGDQAPTDADDLYGGIQYVPGSPEAEAADHGEGTEGHAHGDDPGGAQDKNKDKDGAHKETEHADHKPDLPKPVLQKSVTEPELTVGNFAGTTRLVFRHPNPVEYQAELSEGQFSVRFKWPQDIRLSQLRVQPPESVLNAIGYRDGDDFVAQLSLLPGTGVRHYQEASDTIVDLVPPEKPEPVEAHDEAHEDDAAHSEDAYGLPYLPTDEPKKTDHTETVEAAEVVEDGAVDHTLIANVSYTRDGILLGFPVGPEVPSAAVRRGERLWITFGRVGEMDLEALIDLSADGIREIEQYPSDEAIVLGFRLEPHVLVTAVSHENGWTYNFGDSILAPTPAVAIQRIPEKDAGRVIVKVSSDPSVAKFNDPDIGDELVFVMLDDPVQGLISTRDFVDFRFLPTAQGLVLTPKTDGVAVNTEPGAVIVTRKKGLNLSGADATARVAAELPSASGYSPAKLWFSDWRGADDLTFTVKHDEYLKKISEAHESVRVAAEMDLARFLLANEMPQEALGVLRVVVGDSPQHEHDVSLKVLRGVSNLLARRTEEASVDLDHKDLPIDPHTKLWRAMLEAEKQNWPAARILFDEAQRAIATYSDEWQARIRLTAARASLAVNDLAMARSHFDLVVRDLEDNVLWAQRKLIEGQIAETNNELDKASAIYERLSVGVVEPVAAEAELYRLRLALKRGTLDISEGLDQLEALRFRWRGDATEMATLVTLGELYTELGDYRHGLNTLRIAVRSFPGTPQQREAVQTMARIFEDLFLHGEADKLQPIQALGLYYDFRELTPVGPNGDLMIRRLADRLVDMDLLDQATELLDHQVNKRLRGIARSQIAVKLAMVQLMNHKPEDAYQTIKTTRQARLPDSVALQRRLLEARALMELGRHGHALDIVAADSGVVVDKLRADVYWDSDNWTESAKSLTAMLSDRIDPAEPLDEHGRFDVMRAAIAYTLAGDDVGLEALRRRFGERMANTPDGRAFEIMANQEVGRSVEFRTLVERVAAVDTLEAFMADLRQQEAEAGL